MSGGTKTLGDILEQRFIEACRAFSPIVEKLQEEIRLAEAERLINHNED